MATLEELQLEIEKVKSGKRAGPEKLSSRFSPISSSWYFFISPVCLSLLSMPLFRL